MVSLRFVSTQSDMHSLILMFLFPPGGESTEWPITGRLLSQSLKDSILNLIAPYFSFKCTTGTCQICFFDIKVKDFFKIFKNLVSVGLSFSRGDAMIGWAKQLRTQARGRGAAST